MPGKSLAQFDAIRTLGFAAISPAYANVGVVTAHPVRWCCITNNTAGDLYFTTNTVRDEIFIAKGSNKVIDIQTNQNAQFDDQYVLPIGTQFSVKQITAPTSGAVYIEVLY
jgi:hypothetical protein